LKESHRVGRVNHILSGEQAGADMEQVAEAEKRLELVHAEMEAGDAVFFHSNTLHCPGPNNSENPQWAMICCYNSAANDPYKESHHPGYTPLFKVENTEVLAVEFANIEDDDQSAKILTEAVEE